MEGVYRGVLEKEEVGEELTQMMKEELVRKGKEIESHIKSIRYCEQLQPVSE